MSRTLILIAILLGCFHATARAVLEPDEKQGAWSKPSADGKPWRHSGSGLAFPQTPGTYRLVGEFRYKEGGGVFIRYESLEERARADVFIFPHPAKLATEADMRAVINRELDSVIGQFQMRANAGRYKNVVIDEPADGAIPLWPDGVAPLTVRSLVATKMADTKEGPQEARIKQWTGVTLFNNHLITIRYTHPTDGGDKSEAALKEFVGVIFQVIKDPPLRAQVREMIAAYLADPFGEQSVQAAAAVLAYVQKTPFINAPVPTQPLVGWLEHFKEVAPSSETHLLRAFAMGSAQAALNDADPETALVAGAKQFLLVYREMLKQSPQLKYPEIEELDAAVQKGQGAAWLGKKMLEKK